jgi:hypothetical protein
MKAAHATITHPNITNDGNLWQQLPTRTEAQKGKKERNRKLNRKKNHKENYSFRMHVPKMKGCNYSDKLTLSTTTLVLPLLLTKIDPKN